MISQAPLILNRTDARASPPASPSAVERKLL